MENTMEDKRKLSIIFWTGMSIGIVLIGIIVGFFGRENLELPTYLQEAEHTINHNNIENRLTDVERDIKEIKEK